MDDNRYKAAFRTRVDECGPDGLVWIGAIGNYLQEVAWNHATLLGYGREDLLRKNAAWVMTRMRIKMERYPSLGQNIHVLTWPSARDKYLAYRDFVLSDDVGEILCQCTTAWAHMDIEARKMVSFQEDGAPLPYTGERSLTFESRSIQRLRDPEFRAEVISRRSDLDVNGHVNNVHFIEWALESIPQERFNEYILSELDISFRHECHAGERLLSVCSQNGTENELLHLVSREKDAMELARVRTCWQRPSQ